MDPTTLILASLCIALGGFLKGATGAGTPVVGVPALAVLFNVPMAVAVFSVLNLFSNVWQAWSYRSAATERRFVKWFAVTGAVGALVGSVMLATLPVQLIMTTLALIVFAYIALRLLRPGWHLDRTTGRRIAPTVGFAGGIMQGAGGISAPVSVTFLNALQLSRAEFIGTISVFFMAMSALQIPALIWLGILTWDRGLLAIAGLAPMFAGMALGSWAARFMSPKAFDRAILGLLTLMAIKLIWDALTH